MADGDDLEIGTNNQAQSMTQLVLGLGNPSTTLLKVGTGGGASIGMHGIGNTGVKGEGGIGVRGISTSGVGVSGISKSQEGVKGESDSGIGVYGESDSDAGVLGSSDTGIGVRGSIGLSPFELPSKVGVLGESDSGVGVQGHSFKDTGVIGRSVSGMGVYGESDSTWGAVTGEGPNGAGVLAFGKYGVWASGSKTGVYGQCSTADGYAGYFNGNVFIKGDLTKTGIGSSVAIRFPDRSFRRLCSIESPESWFEDFGEAKLVKGKAEVKIDPDFAKTVNLKTRYHVFVTPHSTKISALAVIARLPGRFRVEHPGGASGTFSYRIVAKRKDIRVRRLERIKMPAPTKVVPA
jgi:hypothetical protein